MGIEAGVRGMVISPDGEVKHSYIPVHTRWHLPGGGAEPAETLLQALARERAEEGNVTLLAEL
jgi:ADP-ribose pyrophosphatase YjhB (NUDIX family)